MPASEAAGMSPADQRRDFIVLPEPMVFTTDVFEREIRVGERNVTNEFLGAGLLARRPFSFDPQRGIVTFGNAA